MSELFSKEWGQEYKDAWNSDREIVTELKQAGFNSTVAFGFHDEEEPHFVMTIENGFITSLENKSQDAIKWDIRASRENWLALIAKPPGLMKLGMAYTSRKMRFKKGDYATMIKDPSLAGAFVKSFALMSRVS